MEYAADNSAVPSRISEAFQGAIDQLAQAHILEVIGLHEKIKTLRADLDFTSSALCKQDAELTALRKKQADIADEYQKPPGPRLNSALGPISPRLHRFCQEAIPILNGIDKDPVSIADLWKLDSERESTADTVAKAHGVQSEVIDMSDCHGFVVSIDDVGAERPAKESTQATDESCATDTLATSGAQTPKASLTPRISVTDLNEDLTYQPDDAVWAPTISSPQALLTHELLKKPSFKAMDSMEYSNADCSFAVGKLSSPAESQDTESSPFVRKIGEKRPVRTPKISNSKAIMSWERLVTRTMQAAQQELLQLLPIWVQPESFMLKVMRTNADIDICAAFNKEQRPALRRGMPVRQTHISHKTEVKQEAEVKKQPFGIQTLIMDPQSPKRIVWALIGMILMVYDLIMIPMQAFELEDHIVIDIMAWLSQIFWTLDIMVSFFTGVYVKSELEMRFQKIVRAYATTWLPVDCLVTLPLWIVLFIGKDDSSSQQASSSIRSAKYVRLLRFLRLARLMKFDHLLSETLEFVNSSTVLLVVGMTKLIFCLALLNHINACLWFAIGNQSGGWVKTLSNSNKGYQYLSAMHWALTQFQGTSDILPGQSTLERLYAVTYVLCALILLSAFVSRLTNMMMSLQQLHSKRTQQQRVVRGYLSNHNISASLSVRVKKYVAWKQRLERNSEYDVEICHVLPPQLIMDLLDEVRHPRLIVHEFFKVFHLEYPRVVRSICGVAMSTLSPAPGEVIFNSYEACHRMYFAVEGMLNYNACAKNRSNRTSRQRTSTSSDDYADNTPSEYGSRQIEIHKGDFLSEGALWTDWKHCGELVVVRDASLFVLASDKFKQVVIENPAAHASAVLYARRFVAVLNRFGFTHSDIIDPMHIMTTAYADEDNDSDISHGTNDEQSGKQSTRTSNSSGRSGISRKSNRSHFSTFKWAEKIGRSYRTKHAAANSMTAKL